MNKGIELLLLDPILRGGASDHPLRNRGRLITHLPMMPGSALYNFIVLLFQIFQAKIILKIGLLAAEISLTQKSNNKSLRKIGLIMISNAQKYLE